MRRSGLARLCLPILTATAFCATADFGAARAQPFGFLFGPQPRGRVHRSRRRLPSPEAEIPLPVPRPRFPVAAPATPPVETTEGSPTPAPLPPPRPAELEGRKPETSKPETPTAAEVAKPAETMKPAETIKPVQTAKPSDAAQKAKNAAAEPAPAGAPKPAEPSPAAGGRPPPPLPPPKPTELAKPETQGAAGPPKPAIAGSGASATDTPRSPDDDPGCPGRLKSRDVAAEPITVGPQPDERCTVIEAVRLTALSLPGGGNVEFPDKPTIACTTADAFSLYVRDLLVPLAKGTFGSPVTSVWTGPGLECRARDHIFGAKLSAHGQGLAIDIAQLKLSDGRMIAVGEPKTDIESGFENASRAGGCGYFHTVLGPGSDAYHRTHWHFDLEVRGSKGDGKYCK